MKTTSLYKSALILTALAAKQASAIFFFQDMKPQSYQQGDELDIYVGQLFSNINSVIYDFYALNWCTSVIGRGY